MKKIIFSLIALVSVGAASAQWSYGPKVGMNIASLSGEGTSSKVGLLIGGFAEYQFSKFSVSGELLYSQQGAKFEDFTDGPVTYKNQKENLGYLNVPILANYYITEGLAVKAGIQPGFLLGAKHKWDGGDADTKDDFKGMDFSIPVGLSYSFDMGLIIDARYNIGVSDIVKDNDGDAVHNNVFAISVGWRF